MQQTVYLDDIELAKNGDSTVKADHPDVPILFEGHEYEIDLSAKNRQKLDEVLAPFMLAGRLTGTRGGNKRKSRSGPAAVPTPRKPVTSASDRAENDAIREWARQQGMDCSDRGRIPGPVREAYEKRGADEEPDVLPVDRPGRPVEYAADMADYKARIKAWAGIKGLRVSKRGVGVSPENEARFQEEQNCMPPQT